MAVSLERLRSIALFATLSEGELHEVQDAVRLVDFPRGSVVFHEGDAADSLLIVMSGRVKVVLLGKRGKELVLSIVGPGSCIGELALLDEGTRSATVMALDAVECLSLTRERFLELLRANRAVMGTVLQTLASRLRASSEQIRTLSIHDVHERVLRALLKLSTRRGHGERGRVIIEPPHTHQLLAQMIGASRETVSHAMRELTRAGYITKSESDRTLIIEARGLKRIGATVDIAP